MEQPTADRRPPISRLKLALVLGSLSAFGPFSIDMYLSGFPAIAADLGTGVGEVQFTLSIFFFGMAAGQLVYGPLADRFGRRRPLLVGSAIFAIASLAVAATPNVGAMTGLRLMQALGGSAGMIIGRAVVRDCFDLKDSAHFITQLMLVQGLAPVIAPLVGAWVLVTFGWRTVFLLLGVMGVGAFLAVRFVLPETLPPERRRTVPVRHLGRIFLGLLRRRGFVVPTAAAATAFCALFAYLSGSPHALMQVYGVSQETYGWLFGLNAVGMIAVAQLNRVFLHLAAPRTVFRATLAVAFVAAIWLNLVQGTTSLVVFMVPLSLGLALVPLIGANGTALAMAASGRDAGYASSIFGAIQFGLGTAVSAAVGVFHDATARPMTLAILAATGVATTVIVLDSVLPAAAAPGRRD
ncbi:MAG: multidrug effflux MFS transporter [Phyllobacteriaceae bacterium]|nr:multidrug effflux MFS transporter [Phyllobacteriaceae bacterium]